MSVISSLPGQVRMPFKNTGSDQEFTQQTKSHNDETVEEKPHKRDVCDQKFPTSSQLHKTTHTRKKFDKKFGKSDNFKDGYKKMNSTKKCSKLEQIFSTTSN